MAFEDDGDDERVRGFAGRLEVIEKPTGRRSWPDAVKARIVRESFAAGVTVSEVARRHRISPQHLTLWPRAEREGQLQLSFDGAADGGHGFVPVAVVEGGELPGRHADERISVEVDGQFIRDNWLSNRVFTSYDDILDHCCDAWNSLIDQPWKIISIGMRDWAHRF